VRNANLHKKHLKNGKNYTESGGVVTVVPQLGGLYPPRWGVQMNNITDVRVHS